METNILPIGSLIRFNELDLIIVGYHLAKQEKKNVLFYAVVPWPLGYMNKDSIKIVSANNISIMYRGYESDLAQGLGMFLNSFLDDEKNSYNLFDNCQVSEIKEEILPIGSVVKHNQFDNQTMIIGYFPVEQKTGKVYKYAGVDCPGGITKSLELVMFNENSIEEVLFTGYCNQYSKEVVKIMEDIVNTNTNE